MKEIIGRAIKSVTSVIMSLIEELTFFDKEPQAIILSKVQIEKDGFGPYPLFAFRVSEVDCQVLGIPPYYPRHPNWKGPTFHLEDFIKVKIKGKGIVNQFYNDFWKLAHELGGRTYGVSGFGLELLCYCILSKKLSLGFGRLENVTNG